MRRNLFLGILIGVVISIPLLVHSQSPCTEGTLLVQDATNGRARCMASTLSAPLVYKATVNINSANTDASAITGLPAKYVVRRVTPTNPSTNLGISAATISVFTGAGATGTTVVSGQLLTTLTGTTKFVDLPLALTTDVLTSSTLYVRCVIAHGSAATVDVYVEVSPLG